MTERLDYKRAGLALIAVSALIFALVALTSGVAFASDHQIRICHALGNGGYTDPTPTKQQIFDPDGHGSFVAGVHPGDIVPPFAAGSQGANSWDNYPGKNWDADGQAIWNNDCVTPETTTTTVAETTTTAAETTTTVEETTTTVEVAETTLTTEPEETTTSSIEDEVMGTEVLPFTGIESDWAFWIALVLGSLGALLVVASKRVEE